MLNIVFAWLYYFLKLERNNIVLRAQMILLTERIFFN